MENIIYENGGVFLIKKKYAKQFLEQGLKEMLLNGNYDDDEAKYFEEENANLIKELEQFNDEEIICFKECTMSGYLAIYQNEVQDYLEVATGELQFYKQLSDILDIYTDKEWQNEPLDGDEVERLVKILEKNDNI